VKAETVSASYAVEESRHFDAFIQSFLPLISGNWTWEKRDSSLGQG